MGDKIIFLVLSSSAKAGAPAIHDIRVAEIPMTTTPPLPSSYVDAIRESCRELREAQNIQVSGYLLVLLHAYHTSFRGS